MTPENAEDWEKTLRDGCYITDDVDESIRQVAHLIAGLFYAPSCKRCGNNRQVWRNQITGKFKCHRVGCEMEQETQIQ